MTIKEIEKKLIEYKNSNKTYHHREKACDELGKIRTKVKLEELPNVCFIIDNYPKYDHFLFRLTDNNFFLHFGLSYEYINKLSKKELHQVAKSLHDMFGKFKLYNEDKESKND